MPIVSTATRPFDCIMLNDDLAGISGMQEGHNCKIIVQRTVSLSLWQLSVQMLVRYASRLGPGHLQTRPDSLAGRPKKALSYTAGCGTRHTYPASFKLLSGSLQGVERPVWRTRFCMRRDTY